MYCVLFHLRAIALYHVWFCETVYVPPLIFVGVVCIIYSTRRIFTLLTGSTAQRFTATYAPLAARRIRILRLIGKLDGR
jgi:hypothetical protein